MQQYNIQCEEGTLTAYMQGPRDFTGDWMHAARPPGRAVRVL